tara:strand:- start:15 stop:326 length:312 start_codon:yes stop_codon:yes gene_type:complete
MLVKIENKTEDQDLFEKISDIIKASPRHEIDFQLSTEDDDDSPSRIFVLTDEDEDECDENICHITRKQVLDNPRLVIWKMIKHVPQLYCLDYKDLYLKNLTLN